MSARFHTQTAAELETMRDAALVDGNLKLGVELAASAVMRTNLDQVAGDPQIMSRYIKRLEAARDVCLQASTSDAVAREAQASGIDLQGRGARIVGRDGSGHFDMDMVGRTDSLNNVMNVAASAALPGNIGTPKFYAAAAQLFQAHALSASQGQLISYDGFSKDVTIPEPLWNQAGSTLAAIEVSQPETVPTPAFEMPTLRRRPSTQRRPEPDAHAADRPTVSRRTQSQEDAQPWADRPTIVRRPVPAREVPAAPFSINTGVAEIQVADPNATSRRGRRLDVARVSTELHLQPIEGGLLEVTARTVPLQGDRYRVDSVKLSGPSGPITAIGQNEVMAIFSPEEVQALTIGIAVTDKDDDRRVGAGQAPREITFTATADGKGVDISAFSFKEHRIDLGTQPLVTADQGVKLGR